jgi:hypothetical protein
MDRKVVKDNELPADLGWLSVLHQFWCTEFWGGLPACGRGTLSSEISVGNEKVIFCKARRKSLAGSQTEPLGASSLEFMALQGLILKMVHNER